MRAAIFAAMPVLFSVEPLGVRCVAAPMGGDRCCGCPKTAEVESGVAWSGMAAGGGGRNSERASWGFLGQNACSLTCCISGARRACTTWSPAGGIRGDNLSCAWRRYILRHLKPLHESETRDDSIE